MSEGLDLADLIQELRELMWRSTRSLRDAIGKEAYRLLYEMDDEHPATLLAIAAVLKPTKPDLAAEWDFLAAVFSERFQGTSTSLIFRAGTPPTTV